MPFSELGAAIQNLPFFTAVRESALPYPVILLLHLSGIALFGGTILMSNLRLLGGALTDRPVSEVVAGLRPWKFAGLLTMLSTGTLLAGAKAQSYFDNPCFQLKITLLVLLGLHAWIFHGRLSGKTAKLAACLSLALWLGVVTAGRLIAYYEPGTAAVERHSAQRQDRVREAIRRASARSDP